MAVRGGEQHDRVTMSLCSIVPGGRVWLGEQQDSDAGGWLGAGHSGGGWGDAGADADAGVVGGGGA